MKYLFCIVSFLLLSDVNAQFRSEISTHYTFPQYYFGSTQQTVIPGLRSDPIQNYRLTSPSMINTNSITNSRLQNQFIWTGTVTSMSFNKGKFGTYYYWDVQGNLRGTRGFIDISRKNKRGFKLLFPWKFFR